MKNVYTVSQVNTYIKNMFAQDFHLQNIYIKGEISNCTYHGSGHIYFTIKDGAGVMSCVMFKGNRINGLKFQLEKGQNVIILGTVNVYERDGKYQVYAKEIILEGAGLLYQRYEELKRELKEMGMFDAAYKKEIPKYATRIGICTAATGAAIQDIINISTRRNPYVQLYLYPSLVQGEMAAPSIVNGLRCLDEMDLDVIIVGRGGGSIEDLWAFNEEIVAREIFRCRTPVVSAVGHEVDYTIADEVADLRAPTPSAAAELTVFDYYEFVDKLNTYNSILYRNMSGKVNLAKISLQEKSSRLNRLSPANRLMMKRQHLDDLQSSMEYMMKVKLDNAKHRLQVLAERLNGKSPLLRISQGYAYVSDAEGNQLQSVDDINIDEQLIMTLSDGTIKATVSEKIKCDIMNLNLK